LLTKCRHCSQSNPFRNIICKKKTKNDYNILQSYELYFLEVYNTMKYISIWYILRWNRLYDSAYKILGINFYVIYPYLQITSVEVVCWVLHHGNFSLQLNFSKKRIFFFRVMQVILNTDRLKMLFCMKMLMKISDSYALDI
jgi:hypothetical protein